MGDFYQQPTEYRIEKFRELALKALAAWDLAPQEEVELASYRENAVYKLVTGDGIFALRVHRAGYHSDAELVSESIWMKALNQAGIETPEVITTRQGDLFVVVESGDVPEPRQVDVISWIAGTPLKELEDTSGQLDIHRDAGEIMARFHNQTSHWQPPENFTRFSWDTDGLLGKNPLWGRFWEIQYLSPEQRETIRKAMDLARVQLQAFGQGADRYGLIHCDLLPENILKDGETVRIIDFDDCGYGWHMFDLVTYMFGYLLEPDPDSVKAAFIEGYRRQRELPDEQLDHYDLFMLLRMMTALGWVHTRFETEIAMENAELLAAVVAETAEQFLAANQ